MGTSGVARAGVSRLGRFIAASSAALDWQRVPVLPDDVVRQAEKRLARMLAFVRPLLALFLIIPLFGWERLAHPALAVLILCVAAAESAWYARRALTRRQDQARDEDEDQAINQAGDQDQAINTMRGDRLIVAVDIGASLVVMVVGSRAAAPHLRNVVMTEVVPFSLVTSVTIAFAIGLRPLAAGLTSGLAAVWAAAVAPDITLKLGSDVLGFFLWYVVGLYIATLLRKMAYETAQAVAKKTETQRELDRALNRERLRRGLHDGALGTLDMLALDTSLAADVRLTARLGALRARNALVAEDGRDFRMRAQLSELAEVFARRGLLVHPRLYVRGEPPAEIAEIALAAVGEALTNARKHAGEAPEVHVFVDCDEDRLELSVRDNGTGFDPETVHRGGGLSHSFPAIEQLGGRCEIDATQGEGTTVALSWERRTGNASANGRLHR
jgi:signal transduction histidine kinase